VKVFVFETITSGQRPQPGTLFKTLLRAQALGPVRSGEKSPGSLVWRQHPEFDYYYTNSFESKDAYGDTVHVWFKVSEQEVY
jgi:hypothetical protein